MRKKDLEELIPRLEAEDAFVRLDAEHRLRELTQRDFGYRWDAPAGERGAALGRLREWIEGRRKKREEARAQAAAAGFAALNLEQLKGMSPQEVEKNLQDLLAKAQFLGGIAVTRPRCQECRRRPATVEVVDVQSGAASGVSRLCDPCAVKRGEIRE